MAFGCSYAQMQPSVVQLKSGEKLSGIGKLKAYVFKYKENDGAKAREIDFSEIESVTYPESHQTYRFLVVKGEVQPRAMEVLSVGGKVELYTTSYTSAPMGTGTGMYTSQTVVNYFIRKPTDAKLTEMGAYSPLMNNLKEKTIQYFSDCPLLAEKIKNGEFRVREGLEKIVAFYNSNCQ